MLQLPGFEPINHCFQGQRFISSGYKLKAELPELMQSLKSSIWSLTSSQMDQTFWEVVSATVRRVGP